MKSDRAAVPDAPSTVVFHGAHQPGITDPTPTHASFLAFDLSADTTRAGLAEVMHAWTTLSSALARGDTTVDTTMVSTGSEPGMFTMTVGIGGHTLSPTGQSGNYW